MKNEKINHPPHYGGDTTYEVIKVIEAWQLCFCLGNAVKYIARAGKKDQGREVEDLKKAVWYLQRRIQQREGTAK
jgi:predicted  nucleic acid-binding Zn ribbon protein